MVTVSFRTLGCKLNQCETAQMEEALLDRGYRLVPWNTPAVVRVLNTCTVTAKTDRECRREIRRALRLDPGCRMVVTGCYAQVAPEQTASIPGVALVLGNLDKLRLGDHLERAPRPGAVVPGLDDRRTRRDLRDPIRGGPCLPRRLLPPLLRLYQGLPQGAERV